MATRECPTSTANDDAEHAFDSTANYDTEHAFDSACVASTANSFIFPTAASDISRLTTRPPTTQSPPPTTPPLGTSLRHGYACCPCEIPPVDTWKPDVDYHDTNKVNGLDFPASIRQSKFSSFKDIEGMDPLQVPLWKFLYQGIHNFWLRRIAYGRETFVPPFDNIGTTVFIAELVAQLRTRVDLDKLAAHRSRASGQNIIQKEATQNMAKEVAQLMQSWLPAHPVADTASQQRILELEAELAKVKGNPGQSTPAAPSDNQPQMSTPIGRASN